MCFRLSLSALPFAPRQESIISHSCSIPSKRRSATRKMLWSMAIKSLWTRIINQVKKFLTSKERARQARQNKLKPLPKQQWNRESEVKSFVLAFAARFSRDTLRRIIKFHPYWNIFVSSKSSNRFCGESFNKFIIIRLCVLFDKSFYWEISSKDLLATRFKSSKLEIKNNDRDQNF